MQNLNKISSLILGIDSFNLGKLFFEALPEGQKLQVLIECEAAILAGATLYEDEEQAKFISAEKVYECCFIEECWFMLFAPNEDATVETKTAGFVVKEGDFFELATRSELEDGLKQFEKFKEAIVKVLINKLTA